VRHEPSMGFGVNQGKRAGDAEDNCGKLRTKVPTFPQ
jgi:hypothetical protein